MTAVTPVIDADAHIAEPPDVFTTRVPRRYGSEVPRIVRNERGMDVWVMGDRPISLVATSAIAGWSDFPFSLPKRFEDAIPACSDASARLRYMDEAGIWAQVLYPNVAGFGSQGFLSSDDETLKLLCVQAYNDFLHEWCSADPVRLIGVMALPFWNVEAAVAEIERCAELGLRGALFTGEPQRFGYPVLGHEHWDPLYAALQATGMPVHLHLGGGETEAVFAERGAGHLHERHTAHGTVGTAAYQMVELCFKNGIQCGDLITCGLLPRFPDLKFVSVETGIGWVPFMLEAADWSYLLASRPPAERYRRHLDDELLPSELFARQVYATYWFEYNAPTFMLESLPVDNIMFETDFPHTSCLYGNIQETIDRGMANAPDSVRRKFLWENAARLYGIPDPPTPWLASLADR
jgi:predicted TIM-barrel fold metal-dependent hydrolase